MGQLVDNLSDAEGRRLAERVGHVREVLTGFRSGSATLADEGEPRSAYRCDRPVLERQQAKADEVGVGLRTVQRWLAAYAVDGPAGLIDSRHHRELDPLRGVDERWLDICRTVLDEHVEASRPTKKLILERVEARVAEAHGKGVVPIPHRKRAHAAMAELTRGTNAFGGATKQKRSIARRPEGAYGRLRATRPGEYLLLDTTPLDVFAMEPLTLRWVSVELTIALDLYTRCIAGLRLSPVSTKAVDAALVLYESITPETAASTGTGILPYQGVPSVVVVDGDRVSGPGLPDVDPETLVLDHGRIYLSAHVLSVCTRLGISIQPARPYTPTDKAAVERFFRTLGEGLLEALPGYKGPDVYSRGDAVEDRAFYFLPELEQVIREWVATVYHRRPHHGLVDPAVPGLDLSPLDMYEHGVARAGRLRVPARKDLVYDFLPVAWRTVQHYGVEINGLRYNGEGLCPYRNARSPYRGANPGKWPIRYDPDDITKVFFQDPDDQHWHTLVWEHAGQIALPFSAEALAYARRLAVQTDRFADDRRVLAELLERWDAGLTANPTERRMALRLSQQRAARLGAAASEESDAVKGLATVRALFGDDRPPTPESPPGGDARRPRRARRHARRRPRPLLRRRLRQHQMSTIQDLEQDYTLSLKEGWFRRVGAVPRQRPDQLIRVELKGLGRVGRLRYEEARSVWHANLGPILTSQMDAALSDLDEIVDANRQDGDKVKSSALLDAYPGLGKTTLAVVFAAAFHRRQIALYGPATSGGHERIPVAYVGLTANTSMRSLNSMLCRFYGHPSAERGNATQLANRAADCVLSCKTRLIVVDDVHFLDLNRRDGREVANHFKWLANQFPVTFLFVGVGLHQRRLLDEGLTSADRQLAQTARRWTRLTLSPFEVETEHGRRTWRRLLLAIERDLVLADKQPGDLADHLADYLYARSTGHFASLMCLISRGCRRAVTTGDERLTTEVLDRVRNDEAAEQSPQGTQGCVRPRSALSPEVGRRGSVTAVGPPPESPRSSVRTLPIRLPPVSGESLDSWLWAYAVRLGVPLRELTAAAGLADAFASQPARSIALGRNLDDQQALASATGVDAAAQDRLWRPLASYAAAAQARLTSWNARRLAMPMASSRFCPSCISANGGRWKLPWRLPWHTVCEDHRCVLADRCPQCNTHQRQHVLTEAGGEPLLPGRCASRITAGRRGETCGHRLDSTPRSPDRALEPSLAFQQAVAPALDPEASDHSRAEAFDLLADVILIRSRLDAGLHPGAAELAPARELAPRLVRAWDLRRGKAEKNLLRLVERDSQAHGVVPRTWSAASSSLTARVVASRDALMPPTDRLRWRSATRPRRPSEDGLRESIARARYVPQALWADWAIRLAPSSGVDHTAFRVAAAAALLAPGTPRPFSGALNGTCHEGLAPKVSHALSAVSGGTELTATLQALSQLADGLDNGGGVIDYRRRREVATSVDMVSSRDWERICATAGVARGGSPNLNHARLWVYEKLTAGPLQAAPLALRTDDRSEHRYHSFALRLPALAGELLDEQARLILVNNRIDEPLEWSPPRHWVDVDRLPGAEPDAVDSERVNRLLRAGRGPRAVAKALGVSLEAVRLAVRRHPLSSWPRRTPHPPRTRHLRPFPAELTPERLRHLVLDEGRGVKGISAEYDVDRKTVAAALARENIQIGPPGGRSRLAIDPDWLRAQYLERLRPLPDIARELGTTPVTLARVAKKHGIPLRGRGGPSHAESLARPRADLPLPLAVAMAGKGGRDRVRRFQVLARSSSIRQAAMRLGCNDVALFSQLTRLERDCGGALVIRYTRTHQRQQLTPLGQGLLDEADAHLGRPSLVLLADVPPPLALALGSLQGAGESGGSWPWPRKVPLQRQPEVSTPSRTSCRSRWRPWNSAAAADCSTGAPESTHRNA